MIDGSMLHVISLLQYLLLYPLPSIISPQVCKILIRSTYESFYFSFSFFFSSMLWRHSNHYYVLPIILLEVEILHYPIDWQRREGRKRILNMYVCEQQGGKGLFSPLSHRTTHRNMCDTMNNNPTSTHQKTISFLFISSLLSHHYHRQRIYALHHEEITQQLSSY